MIGVTTKGVATQTTPAIDALSSFPSRADIP